jgi:hypothetical protein
MIFHTDDKYCNNYITSVVAVIVVQKLGYGAHHIQCQYQTYQKHSYVCFASFFESCIYLIMQMCSINTINKGNSVTCLGKAEVGLQPIHNLVLEGDGWSAPPSSCFTPGKDPAPIVQEAGWDSGPVWTGQKILVPPGLIPRLSSLQRVAVMTTLCRQYY